jgi:hypothetical protein
MTIPTTTTPSGLIVPRAIPAYPPPVPPDTRTNATPQTDNHPSDHNVLTDGMSSIINELGTGPKGTYASLTARLAAGIGGLVSTNVISSGDVNWAGPGVIDVTHVTIGTVSQLTHVVVNAVMWFGYGNGWINGSADMQRINDGGVFAGTKLAQAIAQAWAPLPIVWSWDVAAGSVADFKMRFNAVQVQGGGGWANGTVCYMLFH